MTLAVTARRESRAAEASSVPGWRARLELDIAAGPERSVIRRRAHRGPLVVQRAFHPEANGCCHVYLIHPPGGIVGGDQIDLRVEVGEGARALLTTPAATKLYKSAGPTSLVSQAFRVASGACLEWLPQETIAFAGASARVITRVDLEPRGSFVGWEVVCLGRRAAGEEFSQGHFEQRLEIARAGELLFRERLSLRGGGPELRAPWGMAGHACQGTLLAVAGQADLDAIAHEVRVRVSSATGLFAVTTVGEVLVCRFLGEQGFWARRVLEQVWEIVRPKLLASPAVAPRIWAT